MSEIPLVPPTHNTALVSEAAAAATKEFLTDALLTVAELSSPIDEQGLVFDDEAVSALTASHALIAAAAIASTHVVDMQCPPLRDAIKERIVVVGLLPKICELKTIDEEDAEAGAALPRSQSLRGVAGESPSPPKLVLMAGSRSVCDIGALAKKESHSSASHASKRHRRSGERADHHDDAHKHDRDHHHHHHRRHHKHGHGHAHSHRSAHSRRHHRRHRHRDSSSECDDSSAVEHAHDVEGDDKFMFVHKSKSSASMIDLHASDGKHKHGHHKPGHHKPHSHHRHHHHKHHSHRSHSHHHGSKRSESMPSVIAAEDKHVEQPSAGESGGEPEHAEHSLSTSAEFGSTFSDHSVDGESSAIAAQDTRPHSFFDDYDRRSSFMQSDESLVGDCVPRTKSVSDISDFLGHGKKVASRRSEGERFELKSAASYDSISGMFTKESTEKPDAKRLALKHARSREGHRTKRSRDSGLCEDEQVKRTLFKERHRRGSASTGDLRELKKAAEKEKSPKRCKTLREHDTASMSMRDMSDTHIEGEHASPPAAKRVDPVGEIFTKLSDENRLQLAIFVWKSDPHGFYEYARKGGVKQKMLDRLWSFIVDRLDTACIPRAHPDSAECHAFVRGRRNSRLEKFRKHGVDHSKTNGVAESTRVTAESTDVSREADGKVEPVASTAKTKTKAKPIATTTPVKTGWFSKLRKKRLKRGSTTIVPTVTPSLPFEGKEGSASPALLSRSMSDCKDELMVVPLKAPAPVSFSLC
jgi:hypothetical protein